MNAVDLLKSPVAALPKSQRTKDFDLALAEVFECYLAQVDGLTGADHASQAIRHRRDAIAETIQSLQDALQHSIQGHRAHAENSFGNAMEAIRPELEEFFSDPVSRKEVKTLYRVRVPEPLQQFSKPELFHIPFHLRHRVGTQRYSLPGIPMLYLGASSYVCWEEMGRPNLDSLWISAFRFREKAKGCFLNLAYRPGFVGELLKQIGSPSEPTKSSAFLAAYGIIWPLIAACSFCVREQGAPFIVEYTIPQLLLSWLTERREFLGIRYFSSRVQTPAAGLAAVNFVFPARGAERTGYSTELTELFELTEPVHWHVADAMGGPLPAYYPPGATLELTKGYGVAYPTTRFAQMEARLSDLQFSPLV